MKGKELLLVWAFLVLIILTFVLPFTVFKHTATLSSGFTFFLLLPVVTLICIAIYMAKFWKELLK